MADLSNMLDSEDLLEGTFLASGNPTPSYSPGDFGYPSPGDWDSDYDMGQ